MAGGDGQRAARTRISGMLLRRVLLPVAILATMSIPLRGDDRVLLPIGLVHLNGAYGSVWETELTIHNSGNEDVQIATPADRCSITCPFSPLFISRGRSLIISNPSNVVLLGSPNGVIVRAITRDIQNPPNVQWNFRVRDLSRQSLTWGTELPVVMASQFTSQPIDLLNLPTDSRFRFTVRVYALDQSGSASVRARVFDLESGETVRELHTSLQRSVDFPSDYPLYTQIDSADPVLANVGVGRVGVEISADDASQKLWAFAAVTNNETQDVTTVMPYGR